MARAPKKPGKKSTGGSIKTEGVADTGKPTTDKTTSFRAPAADHVVRSVKKLKSMAKAASEVSGDVGAYVNKLVEDHHYDKRALGMVRKLDKLSDEQLAITLPHLLKYIDDLGLGARAEQQGSLIADEMPDASEDANPAQEAAEGLARSRPRMQLVEPEAQSA